MTIPNKEKYFSKDFFVNLIDSEEWKHDSFTDQEITLYKGDYTIVSTNNAGGISISSVYKGDYTIGEEHLSNGIYKEISRSSVTYYCKELGAFNVNSSRITATSTRPDNETYDEIPSLNGKWYGFSFTNYAFFAVHEKCMNEIIQISNWRKLNYEISGGVSEFLICDTLALDENYYPEDIDRKKGILHDVSEQSGNLYVYLADEDTAGIIWLDFQRGEIITEFLNGWKSMDIKKRLYK